MSWRAAPRFAPSPFEEYLWKDDFSVDAAEGKLCLGEWRYRYWRNFPGPFYATRANTSSLGAYVTEGCGGVILFDGQQEFVSRQPRSEAELQRLIRALDGDEVLSYQCEGNRHWTLPLIRDWWGMRPELLGWAEGVLRGNRSPACGSRSDNRRSVDAGEVLAWIRFLQFEAEEYLRHYCFFRIEGRVAGPGEALPEV
jgi:hypothetical protein